MRQLTSLSWSLTAGDVQQCDREDGSQPRKEPDLLVKAQGRPGYRD